MDSTYESNPVIMTAAQPLPSRAHWAGSAAASSTGTGTANIAVATVVTSAATRLLGDPGTAMQATASKGPPRGIPR